MTKKQNKIENKFIKRFGRELAEKIKEAAESHANGANNEKIGDYFKWALLIVIGYQCLEKKEYRDYHGIKFPKGVKWLDIKKWIRDNAELETYQGDLDYLALFAGVYDYYVKKPYAQKTKENN